MEEGKAYQIEARPKDTVKTLKAVLNLELGFAEQAIQLSFDGKVLSDEMELTEVDLKEGSKLQMEVVEVTEEAVSSSSGEGDAWIRCFLMFLSYSVVSDLNQPKSFFWWFHSPQNEKHLQPKTIFIPEYLTAESKDGIRIFIKVDSAGKTTKLTLNLDPEEGIEDVKLEAYEQFLAFV